MMWTTLWNPSLMPLQWGAVVSASLLAASWDLYCRRIPNWLCGFLFACGLVWAGSVGGGYGVMDALCGSVLMSLPFILLFILAGGGAGDAKFMGAIGAWLGLMNGVVTLTAVVFAGAVIAIGITLCRKQSRVVYYNIMVIFTSLMLTTISYRQHKQLATSIPTRTEDGQGMQTMPYGVAIFVGVCIAGGGLLLWRM